MGTQYKSLLGLTEVIADSAEISNIDLEATNITGLTTSRITEGTNLYYTDTRVSGNPNVSSNTTHRERKDNPHGVTAVQVGIQNTDDIIEGVTNLYYTDIRFDDRLATKTTTSLAEGANLYYTTTRANADFDTRLATKSTTDLTEGANLYYTDARFDNRFGIKTTTNLTEGTNLYYTDARFDTRLATKTTTNLTEGTNLYYTDARFDARLATKTTTNLTEGANLYYTDARFDTRLATKTTTNLTEGANLYYTTTRANADFDTRLATKTTTNLTEGTNLYYTDARFDARLATKTTDDLTEGKNNIYYTDTRVSSNTDVTANTDYRNTGHLPLDGGVMTGEITWDTDIEIPTWSSNTVYTPSDDPNWSISSSSIWSSSYQTFEAFNKTVDAGSLDCWISASGRYNSNGTVSASTYNTTQVDGNNAYRGEWIQVRHTEKKLRLTSFILTARSNNEYSKYYRLLGTNDDPSGSPNWTTLMYNTTQLVWSGPGASLVLTPETRLGYYNTYRLLITQCTIAYCSIARFIPSFVTEGTVIDGTSINGAHVDTLIADVKANTAYTAVGHLPLDGGTLTGDLTVDGELNIGGEKITTGATNGLQLYGPSSNIGGPHIQAFVSTDEYPVFQQLNNSHGSIAMCFDAYADGFTWKSSSTSNAIIYKSNTDFEFSYSSGIAVGGVVTWNAGFSMDLANGLVTCYNGLDVTGDLTVSGTVDGVDLKALETDVKANTAYRNTGHLPLAGGTLTGDLTVSGEINIGGAKIARGATNGLQLYGTQQNLSGPHIQTFVSTDTYPTYQMLNWSHNNVNMTFDAYYDGSWRSSSTTSNLLINKASTSVNFVYDSGIALGGVVTFNTGFSMDLTNGLVTCYNGLEVTGNITVSGTVDGVDLKALETAVDTNTAKVSASGSINTHSDVNITAPADGHLLTYTSGEWKNIAPAGVDGYLPLEGGTLTGDLNINGGLAIGDGKLKGGIRLNGPGRSNDGPHITAYVSDDPYPVFEISNYAHNEATLAFDAYLEDGVWRSGSTASNCLLAKGITSIDMFFSHGIAKGGAMYKQDLLKGFTMNTETGLVICHYGLEVKGDITVSGTVDGVDSSDFLVVDGSRAMTGTLNMGNQDIDNVNQIFVDRSGVANNKIVLYDGGTPSTTAFYGFGIQSATLLYNVDGSSANHKFYYGGTNELFRIGNAAVYSYRNLDVKGNITVSGTVDGIDIQSLNTTVGGKLSLTGGTMSGNIDMGGYNINTVGTVDGYNLDTLNTNINGKLSRAGGGVITNGSINIYTQGRSGSHGAVKGLYVTSDFGSISSGAEFRHSNGTQGIGIGYSGIDACGSNGSQDLNISSKGTGTINLHQNGWNYAVIRRRPSYNNEAQMSFRQSGNGGCGEIVYNGSLNAWASSNQTGNPTGGIVYLSTNSSSWVGASDRRLKCDIVGLEVEDCCARIALLKPCNYCWKADETKKRNTGFIADEVKQVYPDLVSNSNITVGDDENIEGIDYTGMIPILVGAIQSMMGKMNELKNRIEILEKPII